MKVNKVLINALSVVVSFFITAQKLYIGLKDTSKTKLEVFLSADTITLVLLFTSFILIIFSNYHFFRRKWVWLKSKAGWLNLDTEIQIKVKSNSLEDLKNALIRAFSEELRQERVEKDIDKNTKYNYKAYYNSLGMNLTIKHSYNNDESEDELKKYIIVLKGNTNVKKLDKNILFIKAFLNDILVEDISLIIFEKDSDVNFVQKELIDYNGIKVIEEITKDLDIILINNAKIKIDTRSKKAYLNSTSKITFFNCYDDFKYILMR